MNKKKIKEFKLGCNFDLNLINEVEKLNKKYEKHGARITELYGSDRAHASLAARPEFRLPDISKKELKSYIKKVNKIGVSFNYTMNSILPEESKTKIVKNKKKIQKFVLWLEKIGCGRITVANPILLHIIREVTKTMPLEISTIAHVDTVTQLKYYKEVFGVDKVCGNLLKNRSIKFLQSASKYCSENNMKYEVMVNEFCGVAGDGWATHCTFRDSCYLCHATNHSKKDAQKLDGYPMQYCMFSRKTNPSSWLKMRWIRPEDIQKYYDIGLNHFKITGRTGTTKYIVKMAEAYLSGNWEGNSLQLWKPLETIYSEESELSYQHPIYIENKKLDGFLDHWFNNPLFDCANEVCGDTCKYCERYYQKSLKKDDEKYMKKKQEMLKKRKGGCCGGGCC